MEKEQRGRIPRTEGAMGGEMSLVQLIKANEIIHVGGLFGLEKSLRMRETGWERWIRTGLEKTFLY